MNDQLFRLATEVVTSQMLCTGRLINIAHFALQCSALPGDMAEFGCYRGRTAAMLAHIVNKPLWLYDSFEGLPQRAPQDAGAFENFQPGGFFSNNSKDQLLEYFKYHGLREPIVYKGWFNTITPDKLPERICFAHLDGDFYTSIRDSIRLAYPRLVPGAAMIVDDYGWNGLPGTQIALDEYMADKPEKVRPLVTGYDRGFHAVIIKI